jgi:meiotically up-regulated gene 157 (Mug157) protein
VHLEEQARCKANARRLHQIAKYSRASRIFYSRFLPSEDFFAQGYAIPRNTLQMVNRQIPSSPRKDHRGVDLISDALPFGALWYGEPNAITNAT